MADIGASMLGLSRFIVHGLCRGLDGLACMCSNQVVSMLLVVGVPIPDLM
jgi:hypothetical protein